MLLCLPAARQRVLPRAPVTPTLPHPRSWPRPPTLHLPHEPTHLPAARLVPTTHRAAPAAVPHLKTRPTLLPIPQPPHSLTASPRLPSPLDHQLEDGNEDTAGSGSWAGAPAASVALRPPARGVKTADLCTQDASDTPRVGSTPGNSDTNYPASAHPLPRLKLSPPGFRPQLSAEGPGHPRFCPRGHGQESPQVLLRARGPPGRGH